jgi:methionine-S-sulfoxide reductase
VAALEKIVLGAGCFWCIDTVMRQVKGVQTVEVGYAGGTTRNPTYNEVVTGTTGHAEVAQVVFDPAVVSLEVILRIFLASHDPTSLNKQGADTGTEYRSLIAYTSDEHRQVIETVLHEARKWYDKPLVTEVFQLKEFYKAENYHQDFYEKNSDVGYCQVVINPKLANIRATFAEYVRSA